MRYLSGLIGYWKNQYLEGKSANVKVLESKIKDLEQMVGHLTMDNELLKSYGIYTTEEKREFIRGGLTKGSIVREERPCRRLWMVSPYMINMSIIFSKERRQRSTIG